MVVRWKQRSLGGFDRSIDHILLRGVKGTVKRFERYYPDYYVTLSDHFPLWVDVDYETRTRIPKDSAY